jgi:hypothetical protein
MMGDAMPSPVLTLRFGDIGLRLAGFDERHCENGGGFVRAEWSNKEDDRLLSIAETGAPGPTWRLTALATAATIIILAGAVWLWAHFGTTLFFETIRTGFVACFG